MVTAMSVEQSDKVYKWAQLILTTCFGVVIVLGGNIYLDNQNSQIETEKLKVENAKIEQADREFTVRQKDTEVDLTTKMFGMLLERYLKQDTPRDRLLTLRLLALNFSDVPINLRPMFQGLEELLSDANDKQTLKAIAQEVARRQAFRLTSWGDQQAEYRIEFSQLEKNSDVTIQAPTLQSTLVLHVIDIFDDAVQVELVGGDGRKIGPFKVTYYDWPLVDNTKINDKRLSVTLTGVDNGKADLRVILFPSTLAPDRFDTKELGLQRQQVNFSNSPMAGYLSTPLTKIESWIADALN